MKHLLRDLDALQRRIVSMASAAEEAVYKAIRALQERQIDLAEAVLDGEDEIDELENEIEEDCLKMLALHQPVATDLRRIVVALRIINDLERVGDLAQDIAERAVALYHLPKIPVLPQLQKMTDLTLSMVRQSLDSFVHMDTRLARAVCRLDDEVDQYNRDMIDDLIRLMKQSGDNVEPGLSLFSAVRHLERIADHATNIAEEVVYLVEGEQIRHRPLEVEE